ncbi:SDR family oxidoreductase [Conexibacter sp. CPCC 206217]|uniref:SDR family oxidoreductase n=1 Tax=Conexibacter sp. CPCC 206217 TaxID=3064574 RepID=UPI002726462D|nr:SDR family oxidoreductase [Conexibacter sp. CPCC 206217]MDO8210337.1 SDR family oxidoreductase [Conexibacter sp. CPCC 206217]
MTDATTRFSLDGRVCVVTGGAGLYGRWIAQGLAEHGATVVLAARNAEACEAVAAELASHGLRAWAQRLDLADEDSIRELRDELMRRHGRIDVLVNNAVHRAGGDFFATEPSDFAATHRVNGEGLFLITQLCAEQMIHRRAGSIVNIASIYGVVGPDFGVYGDSGMTTPVPYAYDKGGMLAFTRYLATYLGRWGVRANAISPGGLQTDQDPAFVEAYAQRTPLARMAGPEDIKGPIVFLASDASAYVTGTNLAVDGGWTAR